MTELQYEQTIGSTLKIGTQPAGCTLSYKKETREDSLYHLNFSLTAPVNKEPVVISWEIPQVNIHHLWHSACESKRTIDPDWDPSVLECCGHRNMPVFSLYSSDGTNAFTVSLSETLGRTVIKAGISEERATIVWTVEIHETVMADKSFVLRLDARKIPYFSILQDTGMWWAESTEPPLIDITDTSRSPVYSTWYSFHQNLDDEGVLKQCAPAADLGMKQIIVDDGWQTDDNNRGYAFCGDWKVSGNRFPDFKTHVQRAHKAGLKYVLWFSVPFVGENSLAYKLFKNKILNPDYEKNWYVLDPRYPEVRSYLSDIYVKMAEQYDLDGFKLDFIDSFAVPDAPEAGEGSDFSSVPRAVSQLLCEIINRLQTLKPGILIEFRQRYIGPHMLRFTNMLRAGDVPDNIGGNRVGTLDLRLLSGKTPVHSDMFMWHRDEPVESAAMHFIHTLFAVPQVSVLLDSYPEDHIKMIRFILSFWRDHRDVLLDGELRPQSPQLLYPRVYTESQYKFLAAVYCENSVVTIPAGCEEKQLLLVNGTFSQGMVVRNPAADCTRSLTVTNCMGDILYQNDLKFLEGLSELDIPPAGFAVLS